MYVGINEIMSSFPEIKKDEAKRIIKDCQSKMRNDGYYVPNTKRLLALKNYVEKHLGVQLNGN